jgi:hypothetical protein
MATVPSSSSAARAQAMRDAWQGVHRHAATAFGRVWDFFTAYPPLAQGLYYVLTGLWPLLAVENYQRVTGHHADPGLLAQVGAVLLVLGGTLCLAAYRRQGSPEVLFLAFGSALALTATDIHLFVRGLSALYLLDAAIEMGLLAFWVYGWRQKERAAAALAATGATPVPAPTATAVPAPAAPVAPPVPHAGA